MNADEAQRLEADAYILALGAYETAREATITADEVEHAFEAGWDAAIAFTRHQAPQHEGHRRIALDDQGKWWCATCGSGPYAEGVV